MDFLWLARAFICLVNGPSCYNPAWFHLKKGRNPMDLVYVGILALFVLLAWGLLALCDRV